MRSGAAGELAIAVAATVPSVATASVPVPRPTSDREPRAQQPPLAGSTEQPPTPRGGLVIASSTPPGQNQPPSVSGEKRPTSAPPKYPAYAERDARIRSFAGNTEIAVPIEELVDAGFYLRGVPLGTVCFQCGVSVWRWSAGDDPWMEHARFSQDCTYVIQHKGQAFVDLIQQAHQHRLKITGLLETAAAKRCTDQGYSRERIREVIQALIEDEIITADGGRLTYEVLFSRVLDQDAALANRPGDVQAANQSPAAAATTAVASGAAVSEPKSRRMTKSEFRERQAARQTEILKLQNENAKLKDMNICKKCHREKAVICFLPCGHLVTCEACAPSVKDCFIIGCSKYIKGTVRAYPQ